MVLLLKICTDPWIILGLNMQAEMSRISFDGRTPDPVLRISDREPCGMNRAFPFLLVNPIIQASLGDK